MKETLFLTQVIKLVIITELGELLLRKVIGD